MREFEMGLGATAISPSIYESQGAIGFVCSSKFSLSALFYLHLNAVRNRVEGEGMADII
jgi:hypothetical protein